jgi:transcriptional regulator with XRE-family HTH domain
MSATVHGDCYEALARTLILLREIKGISMREHARQIGLSPATLSRVEAGKGCDLKTLCAIHIGTGVKLHTLLGEKP